MAENIYYEAAYEPYEGKLAVAQVTMNRTRQPEFPKTVCGVVFQKGQFSWVDQNHVKSINKYEWEEIMLVARRALTEQYVHEKFYHVQALYYHADYVHPGWHRQQVGQVGRHLFYK
jgi:spore germination cell wall hydrolase CwlJ-like protein